MKQFLLIALVLLLAVSGAVVYQKWQLDPVYDEGIIGTGAVKSAPDYSEYVRYTIDVTGFNLPGSNNDIAPYVVFDDNAKTVTYTYTTQRDNEHLSLGVYGRKADGSYMSNNDECPIVYVALPEGDVTRALTGDDLIVENGRATNIVWNPGYISSATAASSVSFAKVYTRWTSNYRFTDVFTVPKAGTTLTWSESTVSGKMSPSALIISSWIKGI